MPVLDNPKWETFAQAREEGCSQRVAYKKAFPNSEKWKDKTVDNRASELWGVREIRGRYEELKEQAAQGAVMTRKEKRELLRKMNHKMSIEEIADVLDMDLSEVKDIIEEQYDTED